MYVEFLMRFGGSECISNVHACEEWVAVLGGRFLETWSEVYRVSER